MIGPICEPRGGENNASLSHDAMSLMFSCAGNSLKGKISASDYELFKFWLISNVEWKPCNTRIQMKTTAETRKWSAHKAVFTYTVINFCLSRWSFRNQISTWNPRRNTNNIPTSLFPHLLLAVGLLKDYIWSGISRLYFLVCINWHTNTIFSAVTMDESKEILFFSPTFWLHMGFVVLSASTKLYFRQ